MAKTKTTKKATTFPVISSIPAVQAHYEMMRANGESHNFAEMCAVRCAPKMKGSERALMEGVLLSNNLKDKLPAQRESVVKNARKAGINTTGKIYLSELAREGYGSGRDPLAWVSGKDDVIAACKARGVGSARFGVKAPLYTPEPKAPKLNPRIVKQLVQKRLEALPEKERAKANVKTLAGEVIEKHGAKRSHL